MDLRDIMLFAFFFSKCREHNINFFYLTYKMLLFLVDGKSLLNFSQTFNTINKLLLILG